ncbi:MAG: TCR/Tet family MFS transporter [Myxococcales bacterium]|nr:TCR/Tet family MFS transporter [Myxococcales bacterium]
MTTAGPRKAALFFILVTVALDVLALGMIIPVLPKLVVAFNGGDAAKAAIVFGLFVTVWEAMQLVFSPVLGALSDRFGRRPVILLSNLGLGLDYVMMALAPSLTILLVGRVVSGITAASFSAAGAYIADVMPPEKRAAGFGMIGAAFGVGFVVGPALGGVLGKVDPRLPFWVAAGLSLANATYGAVVLPESLPPDKRMPFSLRRANPLGAFALLRRNRQLTGLAAAVFTANLAHFVLQSTFVLYTAYRYRWDEREVGLVLGGVGVCSAIVQGGLIRPVVSRFGERGALMFGLACGAAGFAIYGLASTPLTFALGVPVMSLWGLSGPAAQQLMTKRIGPSEQGQLQGALSSLVAIAGIVGPPLFTRTFAWAIAEERSLKVPGAPFLVSTALLVLTFFIVATTTRSPRDERDPDPAERS